MKKLIFPITLATILLGLSACSKEEDFILVDKPPYSWVIEIVDQDGLNVLNTKDNTFSIIDQLSIEYMDSIVYPSMEYVYKDGYNEYFQCDTCCSYYNGNQSYLFLIGCDDRIEEGSECNFSRPNHTIDYYWNILCSDYVKTIFDGFTIIWSEGNQRWDIKAEINPDNDDCTLYVNGEIAENFNWPGGQHWFSITITH